MDVVQELQMEAIARAPAYHAGPCTLAALDDQDYAACLATPADPPEGPADPLEVFASWDEERFERLLVRIRERRRRQQGQ